MLAILHRFTAGKEYQIGLTEQREYILISENYPIGRPMPSPEDVIILFAPNLAIGKESLRAELREIERKINQEQAVTEDQYASEEDIDDAESAIVELEENFTNLEHEIANYEDMQDGTVFDLIRQKASEV